MVNKREWVISEERDKCDEDKLTYHLFEGGKELGCIEIEVLYESYEYEFMEILSELEFANQFRPEPIVKFLLVEVHPNNRSIGVATFMLTEVFKRLRLAGFTQWFLNASPLDTNGLTLHQLEGFYSKFGFKREQMREESTLMWFTDGI